MPDSSLLPLRDRRILIVEDEYLIAADLAELLAEQGAIVVGPVATVPQALELVEQEGPALDGAVLDVNLRGERSFAVAERLVALGLRPIFTTGYSDPAQIPLPDLPRLAKPIDTARLLQLLTDALPSRIG